MRRVLVIRLSAIGDVAMVIPVLYALCNSNPDCHFTILTQPFLTNLLIGAPNNLEAMVIDIKREEKSFYGLLKFAYRIRGERFDQIIDFHDVIRSKVIRSIACVFSKTKYVSIDKRRKQRKEFSLGAGRPQYRLPSMIDIYKEAISKTELKNPSDVKAIKIPSKDFTYVDRFINDLIANFYNVNNIGIAPFASKISKNINLNIIKEVINRIIKETSSNIILFCSKGKESDMLNDIENISDRVFSLAGKLNLNEEICLISKLDCMVSMDSANMHFASMVGIPVVSLWGGTNPNSGFLGLDQSIDDALVPYDIDCSPCSIFGTNKCQRGDFACCDSLNIDNIIHRIKNYLNK